jgi:hypothetical protein
VESLLPLSGGADSRQKQSGDSTHWITHNYRWIKDLDYQKHSIHWVECALQTLHRTTDEKTDNRFVFLTNLDVNHSNIDSVLLAGRARWNIEDHFNQQKNRGGSLHHKFNRKNFNAIKNWHSVRQLVCMINEFVKYTAQLQQMIKENTRMTWKELWKNFNSLLSMCIVDDIVAEFEVWSAQPRQVRLE